MGVEYKHFIIPADPTFVPSKDVIIKIDNLLQKWKLKTNEPQIYDLTNGENVLIELPLNTIEFDHGIGMEYSHIGGEPVRTVMGISHYKEEISDKDRYIERINFIVGTDYRIHPSNEELFMTVSTPPYEI